MTALFYCGLINTRNGVWAPDSSVDSFTAMKRVLSSLFLVVVAAWALFAHYLSHYNAKRLIYASFAHNAEAAGSGTYDVEKVEVDSIQYKGTCATIFYRLTGSYQNGSINNAPTTYYQQEPTYLEVRHGFFGWKAY